VILKSIDVGEPSWGRVTKAVKSFGIFLGRSFLHALGSISAKAKLPAGTGEVEVDFAAVRDIWEEYQRAAHPEKGYLNEFETALRSWIEETISNQSERMVIFIDDLDRCLPPVMLNVLEALKLYLDIKDLVFVLGLDREVIDEVVKKHYRDNGVAEEKAERYLDKMFQVEVTMQPTDVQVEAFLDTELQAIGRVTNQYWETKLSPEEQKVFRNVVLELAQQNPREVKRLLAYPVRALVVEATWEDIEAGGWRSQTKANAVIGSLLAWMSSGLPVILAGDHRRAAWFTSRLLFVSARRRWREARALSGGISANQSSGRRGSGHRLPKGRGKSRAPAARSCVPTSSSPDA